MGAPKTGLPAGCVRLLQQCSHNEVRPLSDDELNVARVLAKRGLLELLPGCERSYGTTAAGEAAIDNAARKGASDG